MIDNRQKRIGRKTYEHMPRQDRLRTESNHQIGAVNDMTTTIEHPVASDLVTQPAISVDQLAAYRPPA